MLMSSSYITRQWQQSFHSTYIQIIIKHVNVLIHNHFLLYYLSSLLDIYSVPLPLFSVFCCPHLFHSTSFSRLLIDLFRPSPSLSVLVWSLYSFPLSVFHVSSSFYSVLFQFYSLSVLWYFSLFIQSKSRTTFVQSDSLCFLIRPCPCCVCNTQTHTHSHRPTLIT